MRDLAVSFTIAMHILTYIATAPAEEEKVTSEVLADSGPSQSGDHPAIYCRS